MTGTHARALSPAPFISLTQYQTWSNLILYGFNRRNWECGSRKGVTQKGWDCNKGGGSFSALIFH